MVVNGASSHRSISVCLPYYHSLDKTGLVVSGLNCDATLPNLELIGEAATHIPNEFRAA